MATQIGFNDLNTWLQSQPANTPSTPYELEITGLTINDFGQSDVEGSLGYVLYQNYNKIVDLSATTIPNGVTSLRYSFSYCPIVKAPVIPDSVVDMTGTFSDCELLTTAPVIPNSVVGLGYTFSQCINLVNAPTLPNSIEDLNFTFYGCTSLQTAPAIPTNAMLQSLRSTFDGCSSLETAPVIPSNIISLMDSFHNCFSLKTVPVLPSSIEYLNFAFYCCSSLETFPNIPNNVIQMYCAFSGCSSLKKIEVFEVPLATLKNNTKFQYAFAHCPLLEQIGYVPKESDDWHLFSLNLGQNNVHGTIYARNGDKVSISSTAVTKTTIKLPVKTDELMFAPNLSDADVESLIEGDSSTNGVIDTKYSWYIRNVIPPTGNNFIMYAKDPNNFQTNLPIKPVDVVQDSNMSPVTSNAVFDALSSVLTIKRLKDADTSATGTTYSLDTGESFLDWDFVIPIVTLYDREQTVLMFIPKAEIESNMEGGDSEFLHCGSTGGTDRRLAWSPKSATTYRVGLRNGTSGHLPHLYGFYGVKFG